MAYCVFVKENDIYLPQSNNQKRKSVL